MGAHIFRGQRHPRLASGHGMSALASLRERLRALLFWGREERAMDEELAFHLDMQTQMLADAGDDGVRRADSARRRPGTDRPAHPE